HGTLRAHFGIVEYIFSFGDSFEQFIVLGLVGIVLAFLIESIKFLPFMITDDGRITADHAFGSHQHFINPAHGARNMSALAVHHRAIGISELYIVMVKNFTVIFPFTHLA